MKTRSGLQSRPEEYQSEPSNSLWSLSSSFAQRQSESKVLNGNSLLWDSKFYVRLAIYSLFINAATVYRFPESVYKHGGAFILAYITALVLLVQPLVYLELLLGQLYWRKVPVRAPRRIFGVFTTAIRIATPVLVLLFLPNQSILNLFSSTLLDIGQTSTKLPWCTCDFERLLEDTKKFQYSSNALVCSESDLVSNGSASWNPIAALSPAPEVAPMLYLRKEVLYSTPRFRAEPRFRVLFNWKLLSAGICSVFLVLYFSFQNRSVRFLTRILLWITYTLPLFFVGLLLFLLHRSGRVKMMISLFTVEWNRFGDVTMWQDAVRLAFISSLVGLGIISSVSSATRMSFKRYYSISWLFILYGMAVATVSTLVMFAEVELLSMISGMEDHQEILVGKVPGMSSVLLSSVFCHSESTLMMRSIYGLFYVLKTLAFCRVQFQAVESIVKILRNKNLNCVGQDNRKSVICCFKFIIIVFMQLVMTIPYVFQGSELFLKHSFLLDGIVPITLMILLQIAYLTVYQYIDIFEEDLYLSYRLKIPRIFRFQLKYYVIFALHSVCVVLMLYEACLKVTKILTQSFLGFCTYWRVMYGLSLNAAATLIFLALLLWKICSKKLKHRRRTKAAKLQKEDPLSKWRAEVRNNIHPSGGMSQNSTGATATINASHLRNPPPTSSRTIADGEIPAGASVDMNDNEFPSGIMNSKPNSVPVKDDILTRSKQTSAQTSLDFLDLNTKKLSRISSLKQPNGKKKSQKHHVVRQIRRRRPALPPEWSPGGLGDFSLYNVHQNGRPPGPDVTQDNNNNTNNNNTGNAGHDVNANDTAGNLTSLTGNAIINTSVRIMLPAFLTPIAEADDSIPDFDSDLPPPPKFLLQEMNFPLVNVNHERPEEKKLLQSPEIDIRGRCDCDGGGPVLLQPYPSSDPNNNPGRTSPREQEGCSEIYSAIQELDQVLTTETIVIPSPISSPPPPPNPLDVPKESPISTTSPVNIPPSPPRTPPAYLDLISPGGAEEMNLSVISTSTTSCEEGDGSNFCSASDSLNDPSPACYSFVLAKENQL